MGFNYCGSTKISIKKTVDLLVDGCVELKSIFDEKMIMKGLIN